MGKHDVVDFKEYSPNLLHVHAHSKIIRDEDVDGMQKQASKLKEKASKWFANKMIDAQEKLLNKYPELVRELSKKKMNEEAKKNVERITKLAKDKIGDFELIETAKTALNDAVEYFIGKYGDFVTDKIKSAYITGNEL